MSYERTIDLPGGTRHRRSCAAFGLSQSSLRRRSPTASAYRLAAGNLALSSVKVWDVNRPERELYSLAGHGIAVQAISFSPDSRRIATCARPENVLNEIGGETKIWDAESGQELLSLPGAARTVRFNTDGTMLIAEAGDPVIGDIRVQRWDASPLPSLVDAQHTIAALAAPLGKEALPLMSEMLARIDADQALPDETRSDAIALVKGLRREKELRDAAWAIAASPKQPREQFERALRYVEEALAIDPTNRPAWTTRALVHYRLGQSDETLAALARGKQLRTAENLAPPAEDLTILTMTQHDSGQHDEARTTLEQARASFSLHESEWQELLAEVEQRMNIPEAADNPQQWVGRKVMPRRLARPENENGDFVYPEMPWVISNVEGDRLWFGTNSVPRSHVVLLEDAIRFYTADLQVARRECRCPSSWSGLARAGRLRSGDRGLLSRPLT